MPLFSQSSAGHSKVRIIELDTFLYTPPLLSKPEGQRFLFRLGGWGEDSGRVGHCDHPSMVANRIHSHPEDMKNLITSWHQTPSAVFLAVPAGGIFLRKNSTTVTEYSLMGQSCFTAPHKMKYKQGFSPRKPAGFFVFNHTNKFSLNTAQNTQPALFQCIPNFTH